MDNDNLITKLEQLVANLLDQARYTMPEEQVVVENNSYQTMLHELTKLRQHITQLNQTDAKQEEFTPAQLQEVMATKETGSWHWGLINNTFQIDPGLQKLLDTNVSEFNGGMEDFIDKIDLEYQDLIRKELTEAQLNMDVNNLIIKPIAFVVTWSDGSKHKLLTNISTNNDKTNPVIFGICWEIQPPVTTAADFVTTNMEVFTALADKAPIGIYQLTNKGKYTYCNKFFANMLGYEPEQLLGMYWLDLIDDEDRDKIQKHWDLAANSAIKFREKFRIKTENDNKLWISCEATPLPIAYNNPVHYIGVSINISDQQAKLENMHYLAYYDALTGLGNRTLFTDRLKEALQRNRRINKNIVLMFLDLDGFKDVNDNLGHDAGDELLKQVARRLESSVRKTDTIARLGGDEFTLLFESIDSPSRISISAQKVTKALAKPFTIHGKEVLVTCSIGIAVGTKDTVDYETLIKQADSAMYRAKKFGKNNFQYYTEELNIEIHRKLLVSNKIKEALAQNELIPYYQPQINMQTKQLTGAEVLLRWFNNDLGQVSPAEFVPVAEDNGMIKDINKWLIEAICLQAMDWQQMQNALNNIYFSINLSPNYFYDKSLLPIIKDTVTRAKIPPERIVCEITEGILIENRQETKYLLKDLKNFGISIALDDFGTGYSSLSSLVQFPVDMIKIDHNFIKRLPVDYEAGDIVSAIIALANNLHIKVIAEGVENEAIKNFLVERGCIYGQGYFFAKPMPAKELVKWFMLS